jgi:hypothetical protein
VRRTQAKTRSGRVYLSQVFHRSLRLGLPGWHFIGTDRRNQKERDQWVRDQRKSEWRNLLDSLTSIQEAIPSAFSKQLLDLLGKNSSVPDKYLLSVAAFKRQLNTLLFAADSVKTIKFSEKFENLIEFAKSMKIVKDSEGMFESFDKDDRSSYSRQFNELVDLIHSRAIDDLNSLKMDDA